MPPYGWTASKASLDRVENPALSLAIASRRPGMSAAVLIARHVGLLHDAEEGASRDPGTRDWDLCPLGHGGPPSRPSPARAARNEAPPAKRQPCGRSRGNE